MSKIPENFLKLIASEQNVSQVELDTLNLVLSGQTAEKVAKILDISPVAVRKRLGSVYQKFRPARKYAWKIRSIKEYSARKISAVIPNNQYSITSRLGRGS